MSGEVCKNYYEKLLTFHFNIPHSITETNNLYFWVEQACGRMFWFYYLYRTVMVRLRPEGHGMLKDNALCFAEQMFYVNCDALLMLVI